MTPQGCDAPDCPIPVVVVASMVGTDSLDGVSALCWPHALRLFADWVRDPENVDGWCFTRPQAATTG